MAAQRTTSGSALLSVGLLAAVIALIAGILGMHVMTGDHSAHAGMTVSEAGTSAAGTSITGHDNHGPAPQENALVPERTVLGDVASPTQCSCSGNCASQHAMAASCIPSVAPGGLTAPLPDTSVSITAPSSESANAPSIPWSYRPGSPSPGELSISRT
ncbi:MULTISPECIES: DUF6153 family protein [Paenarthrobacter]|uniref:DUF6153 family protein n=1 Tax=Paenarthrobacter ureafaciens TaxID=37931 RepID=A0AAX3EJK6_PAEUR|nr:MULTISPECIES: DUF6153 family protein [Paenarthrobacter]NKR13907.1 hypothetical protein [Arthrobacter sp. M5]NKR17345.1 hypothetical protein [Arthrobacter sp. M6]OEH58636.1 hypothetical protein A5N17_21090 [Arthrobacter sp. D2]OEH61524.1 hypothetical protein A5N13_16585 [Arthrobacter sp. D4]MDO5862995.1 DUF6153 family protein [Paenarthrobacter sp. SD-2]